MERGTMPCQQLESLPLERTTFVSKSFAQWSELLALNRSSMASCMCAPLRRRLSISQACWWADVSRLAWIASQPSCRSHRLCWQRERLGFVFQGQADQIDYPVQREKTRIDDQVVEHRIVHVPVMHRLQVA